MTQQEFRSAFWDDLADDLNDPEFLREYVSTSVQVETIDAILNELNDAREAAGLNKAELARAVSANPAAIRRLFSTTDANPTLGTLARVAAVLGLRISVEPLGDSDLTTVTEPLLTGTADDIQAVAAAAQQREPQRA